MPKYVKLTKGTQADPNQTTVEEVVVSDFGNILMTGAKPVVNNSATFADLAAATTAHNALLAALRTRGVIGGA